MHYAVMISSTFKDLVDLRLILKNEALAADLFPKVMEHNDGDINATVLENSLAMVRDSHAYVLLIGRRYGQRPNSPRNPKNLSITELEFEEAVRLNRPIKLIIQSEHYPAGPGDDDQRDIDSLKTFRKRAKKVDGDSGENRIYNEVSRIEEFVAAAAKIMQSLAVHLTKNSPGRPSILTPPDAVAVPTDCTGATRLQTALFKRIDEIRQHGSAEQKLLLRELPQCASRSSLDEVLNKSDGGRRFIQIVRYRAIEFRKRNLADALAHEFVLLFLVGAERHLQQKVGSRCQLGYLQLAVDSQTFGCVLGACLRNCGVHFELDLTKGEMYATNVISDLPLAEAGISQEQAMRHELSLFEQRALGAPLDASRALPSIDDLSIRFEILEQEKNVRPALAFPDDRVKLLLSDPACAEVVQQVRLDVFQFSSADGIDLREIERDLKETLAFILPTIKTR